MATSTLPLLLFLSFLVASASARPCKTIFYFSATTTATYYPSNSLYRNPSHVQIAHPRYITLIFTTTTAPNRHFDEIAQSSPSEFPLKFFSSVSSSVRGRTMDILSVVGALLFGVGCGALTAAVLYTVWALVSSRGRVDFDEDYSDFDDDEDKFGYVAIPTQAKAIDDDLKKPAKEVV